jgi:Xaa-Pro aminopeptidase
MLSHSVFTARIQSLRDAMASREVDACVVLSADPHLSEYLPERWQGRQWLSGFEGSAGTLVVTADFAGLWTDSRYWEQAEADLDGTGIQVQRAGAAQVLGPAQWLAVNLHPEAIVSLPGEALSLQACRQWQDALSQRRIRLSLDSDLLSEVWLDRPGLPQGKVYEHLPPFASRTRQENLAGVRADMAERGAQWHWLSSLDDIAWLFNLRGNDVPFNPVFLSHALIGMDTARIFVDPDKIDDALRHRLMLDGVSVEPYDDAGPALACLAQDECLLVDPARTTVGVLAAAAFVDKIEALNPSQRLKARKNPAEIEQVRRTMEQDGAALCEFFAWFESAQGAQPITELTIDEEITKARCRRANFVSPSFGTIAAFNANGAMPHYHATPAAHARIEGNGFLLIDSGGQYLGGTTDITRVVPVGELDAAHRRDYTVVLKGMIALSLAVFPAGTAGPALDAIARLPLWQAGIEFGHGTGHGVGYFLNVHEGPQTISYRTTITPDMGIVEGMITSNEPGLYRPGSWGIRIENLILAVPAMRTEFGDFLKFETLTLCPIDTRCVDMTLMTSAEIAWLNAYHVQVRERLLPLVDGPARSWLLLRTQELAG